MAKKPNPFAKGKDAAKSGGFVPFAKKGKGKKKSRKKGGRSPIDRALEA